VVIDLIEAGIVTAVVTTGANVTHDLVNATGGAHYIGSDRVDDTELARLQINRIYDTFLPETCYNKTQTWVEKQLSSLRERRFTPEGLVRLLGERLEPEKISFVGSAARHGVPVFVPAFSDCELALDVAVYNHKNPDKYVTIEELPDVESFARMVESRPRRGAIVLGGGVPRNWTQQVFPYLTALHRHDGRKGEFPGYDYGVRITTDRPEFGGLSGCTFSESVSWGKYTPESTTVSVICDITIALPLLAGSVLERLARP